MSGNSRRYQAAVRKPATMTENRLRTSHKENTMRRLLRVAAVAGLALVPAAARAQTPQYLNTNPQSTAPFSPAVKVGNMLYLAGQEGTDHGKLAPGGIGPETKQALTNIKGVLEANGSDMQHVVKCTVFLADMKEWGAMNEVYKTMFTAGKLPARSAFGTTGLANDARTEIECIAVVK
jgi:2-iminobutanoate/2-iminopropanoate deaminase